jgi:mRNA interferase RelE/StbE
MQLSVFLEKKTDEHVFPQLQEEPHFGKNIKKLHDYDPPTWRYRIGKFRLFYLIDEDEKMVYVLTVDHRRDAYR